MPNADEMVTLLQNKQYDQVFQKLYHQQSDVINKQRERYIGAVKQYKQHFNANDTVQIFSCPGRTEICGNHTDHNNGKVLAASIDLDIVAVVTPNPHEINMISDGYTQNFKVDLNDLSKNHQDDLTTLILKGLLAGFKEMNYSIGGFNAFITSNVFNASGLSSSAAFEMLVCSILNHYYHADKLDVVTCSKIGQWAENQYWDKPSGLLDQISCAHGGMVYIDFKDRSNPLIKKINFKLDQFDLIIVNTGKGHADLTDEYAGVSHEMTEVARCLGQESCRQLSEAEVLKNFDLIREKLGDRALLRAFHFFDENERVEQLVRCLAENDEQQFLDLISASGDSSWQYLQNCYSIQTPREQNIPLALAITKQFIRQNSCGACRIHGGGFAGVIITILPREKSAAYFQLMARFFNAEEIVKLKIRQYGAVCLDSLVD